MLSHPSIKFLLLSGGQVLISKVTAQNIIQLAQAATLSTVLIIIFPLFFMAAATKYLSVFIEDIGQR
jgi:hypothetical protein